MKISLEMNYLLRKCIKGRTQNPNESVHSRLWNKLSKSKYYGLQTVLQATATTAMEHNFGYSNINVMQCMNFSQSAEHRRFSDATRDYRRTASAKKLYKKKKQGAQDPDSDPDYGGGNF